jgi:hypothetical protein
MHLRHTSHHTTSSLPSSLSPISLSLYALNVNGTRRPALIVAASQCWQLAAVPVLRRARRGNEEAGDGYEQRSDCVGFVR